MKEFLENLNNVIANLQELLQKAENYDVITKSYNELRSENNDLKQENEDILKEINDFQSKFELIEKYTLKDFENNKRVTAIIDQFFEILKSNKLNYTIIENFLKVIQKL